MLFKKFFLFHSVIIGLGLGFIIGKVSIPAIYCSFLYSEDTLSLNSCDKSFLVVNADAVGIVMGVLIGLTFGWIAKKAKT